MHAELRKLAAKLREQGKQTKTTKMVKCAKILRAATALRLISQKIGG